LLLFSGCLFPNIKNKAVVIKPIDRIAKEEILTT